MNAPLRTSPIAGPTRRKQRTIRRAAVVRGVGFFTNSDVTLTLRSAPEDHGLVFQRIDLPASPEIPADIDNVVSRQRRTAIAVGDATVEMTEHVLAALFGLQIDNCLIQLNAPEPPGCDGSSQRLVDALIDAEITTQDAPREVLAVDRELFVEKNGGNLTAGPDAESHLTIGYQLDYGPNSPIPQQSLQVEITPETFVRDIAFARTFILEAEITALRNNGYGVRLSERDLLVFRDNGDVLGNALRAEDECARHKILDCLGDFALIGCDLCGQFNGLRSGHVLNRKMVKQLRNIQNSANREPRHRAA